MIISQIETAKLEPAIAVTEQQDEPQVLKQILNEADRVLKGLRKACELKVCLEAGPHTDPFVVQSLNIVRFFSRG